SKLNSQPKPCVSTPRSRSMSCPSPPEPEMGIAFQSPRGRGTPPYTKPFSVHSSTHLKEHNMQSGNIKTADRLVEADETSRLISSEKVDGTAVYNGEGQHLGAVHHLMIDKFSGHVEYAVMSFGGFLGIGESYHPLPWRALTYSPNWGGYC